MPRLSTRTVLRLLPKGLPPLTLPALANPADANAFIARSNPLQGQIFAWVSALQAFVEAQWPRFEQYALPDAIGFGFIPVRGEAPRGIDVDGGYVFGAAFNVFAEDGGPDDHAVQQIYPFEFGNLNFPLVVTRRPLEDHLHDVSGGTATCWARSSKLRAPDNEGLVTAEHCVRPYRPGDAVPCSAPGAWTFGARASAKIDAAIVVQASSVPPHAGSLPLHRYPVAHMATFFYGLATKKTVSCKITYSLVHPTIINPRFPMFVFLDGHGLRGDSGALLRDSGRRGVGIYRGRQLLPDKSGYEGVAQFLAQVGDDLGLDFYRL